MALNMIFLHGMLHMYPARTLSYQYKIMSRSCAANIKSFSSFIFSANCNSFYQSQLKWMRLHQPYSSFTRAVAAAVNVSPAHSSNVALAASPSSNCWFSQQCRGYTNRNILSLHERGLWKARFPESGLEFERSLAQSTQTVYAGFDPTADSLHIGNLLVIMALLHCQRAGHKPIVLLGGFTSVVGDPSGRSTARSQLSQDTAATNLASIQSSINNIFGNHSRLFWSQHDKAPLSPARFVDNSSWLGELSQQQLVEVLRHIRVLDLLRSSFIKDRLGKQDRESSLMSSELVYQVYQAYDWLYLYDKYDCKIQIGGSDQMANMWLGHDLIRDCREDSVTGLTVPLVTSVSGEKLGKSAGNAVWLSSSKTSFFDFYQYFLRRRDDEVEELLKLFTFMSLGDIKILMQKHDEDRGLQIAQKKLAEAVTLLVHGEHGLKVAKASTNILYHDQPTALLDLSPDQLTQLFSDQVKVMTLEPGTTVLQAAMAAKCFTTQRDGEDVIRNGGFRINQYPARDPHLVLLPDAHILPSGYSLFKVGKRRYTLISWTR